jgi:hypothetical protein
MPLEVSVGLSLYLQKLRGIRCRQSNSPVVRLLQRWPLQLPAHWPGAPPQAQSQIFPAGRKAAPVRASPRQVQTPSFTAQKRAIRSPTLWTHEGAAVPGTPNTASAHSHTSIKSIRHGWSNRARRPGGSSARQHRSGPCRLVRRPNRPSPRHRVQQPRLGLCDKAHAIAVALHAQPVTVIFDLVEPVRGGWNLGSASGNAKNKRL